jgi:hypothetical protein
VKLGQLLGLLLSFFTASGSAVAGPAKHFEPRAVAWEGKGIVYASERKIEIGVRTRISKEGDVVSESWPIEQGESALRRMIIDKNGGWIERGGKREPMPPAMLEHERQQYGFYAQLQEALSRRDLTPVTGTKIVVKGTVTTSFSSSYNRIPFKAMNRVSSPEAGGKPITQIFVLTGQHVSNGLEWPRKIRIYQHGKLFFDLEIDKFEAGTAP